MKELLAISPLGIHELAVDTTDDLEVDPIDVEDAKLTNDDDDVVVL